MQHVSHKTAIPLFLGAAMLQGCSWVDSTGGQTTSTEQLFSGQTSNGILVPIIEFESIAPPLVEGVATPLLENTANKTRLEGRGKSARYWQWELTNNSDLSACEALEDFDSSVATDSLTNACSFETDCNISIEEKPGANATEFIVSLPELKAPVALHYALSVELDDGQTLQRSQTLCALSVNEQPTLVDDEYVATPGEQLIVMASDSNSLLANDTDDIDVRNQPLRVDTQAVQVPEFADQFQLKIDGGFIYRASADVPLDTDGRQTDSFVYRVTDGIHSTLATATIRIAPGNETPVAVGNLPDFQIDRSDINANPVYRIDVSPYFTDANADPLNYTIETSSLPKDIRLQINDQGLLTVLMDQQQLTSKVGTWAVEVIASDGLSSASTGFTLTVINSQSVNRSPTVRDISNRVVRNTFTYDISKFFFDPDGDELTYTSTQLPPGLQLSSAGVLWGVASRQNSGRWVIRINATDPSGNSVDDAFALQIND